MKTSHTRRNVALYKLFMLFSEPLFWGPIVILSLQKLGHLSVSEIYYMEFVVTGIIVILDIPAGALADVIGRKKTLIIGRVFLLGSTIGFAMMSSPLDAWISNILWAIGYAFQSGSGQSLLHDTLKESRIGKSFTKIEGCAVSLRFALIAVCSIGVGYVAEINLRIPLFLSIPFMTAPLVVSFFLKEKRATDGYSVRKQLKTLGNGVKFVLFKPELLWAVGFGALIASVSKIWFFAYNPYFVEVGTPLWHYGIIFFCLNAVACVFSKFANRVENHFKERICVLAMILCTGVPILLMGLFPCGLMAWIIIFQNVVRGFMTPFMGNFMNKRIDSGVRTTALSVQSTVSAAFSALSLWGFGYMSGSLGLIPSLIVLGVVAIVLGQLSYMRYKSSFSANSQSSLGCTRK